MAKPRRRGPNQGSTDESQDLREEVERLRELVEQSKNKRGTSCFLFVAIIMFVVLISAKQLAPQQLDFFKVITRESTPADVSSPTSRYARWSETEPAPPPRDHWGGKATKSSTGTDRPDPSARPTSTKTINVQGQTESTSNFQTNAQTDANPKHERTVMDDDYGSMTQTWTVKAKEETEGEIMFDCSGVRFHRGHVTELKGDGVCDNGWVSVNLSCTKFDFDGGDCDEDEANVLDDSERPGYMQDHGDGASSRDPNEQYIPNTDTKEWQLHMERDIPSTTTVPLPVRLTSGVTEEQITDFQQDGHILVEGLITPDELAPFRSALKKSSDAQAEQPVGGSRGDPNKAFRRTMDSFRRIPGSAHFNFTTSPRLAEVAARLLGTSGVRVFMDQIFYKYHGDHQTTWHTDMPMFPFLFNGPCLSAWIPLVDVEEEHGPLRYLSESQNNEENVFQFIPHDHPQLVKAGQSALDMIEANEYFDPAKDRIRMVVKEGWTADDIREGQDRLIMKNYGETHVVDYGSREAGDVSFHSCRLLHAAGPNRADDNRTREALAIVFIGSDISSFAPKTDYGAPDINYAPALLPKSELRRIGLENAAFFKMPINQMSWMQTAWLHAPFHDPEPGEMPKLVHFGTGLPKEAQPSETSPLFTLG